MQNLISSLQAELKPVLRRLSEDQLQALRVTSDASAAHIKKAYRQLALKYHPDKNKGGTVELFKCIQAAFEQLKDGKVDRKATKRAGARKKRYDEGFFRSQSRIQVPQDIRVCECTTSSATVQWNPPPGVDVSCYELQWKEARESQWSIASSSLQSTICQKHNLEAGNQYHFRVRALHARTGTWSPFTATLFVETMQSIPGRVVLHKEKSILDPRRKRITLYWTTMDVSGASGMLTVFLQMRLYGSTAWEEKKTLNNVSVSSSFCVENLQVNQEYEFRIRAQNAIGEGCWSRTLKLHLETEYHKQKRKEEDQLLEEFRKRASPPSPPVQKTKYVMTNSKEPNQPKFFHPTWSTTDFVC